MSNISINPHVHLNLAYEGLRDFAPVSQMGLLATGTTPYEFAEVIRRDTPRWGEVIRKAGIKPE